MAIRMQQQTQVHKFGNRETAESVLYRQYFNQTQGARGRKITTNLNDGNENSETTAKDTPPPANAAPFTPEAAKPRDAKPMRKDAGNFHRTDTPSVHDEGVIRKSPINPRDRQHVVRANYGDNQKKPNRSHGRYQGKPAAEITANDAPPLDKRIAPEDTPGRVRTNPSDRAYGTPHHDVTVPPFAGWDDNDPASGEKYTGIFNIIADNRRNPPEFQESGNLTSLHTVRRNSNNVQMTRTIKATYRCAAIPFIHPTLRQPLPPTAAASPPPNVSTLNIGIEVWGFPRK